MRHTLSAIKIGYTQAIANGLILHHNFCMDIGVSLKEFGQIDITKLKSTILNLSPNHWLDNQIRQNKFEVHAKTKSIVLIFADGWPVPQLKHEAGWGLLADDMLPLIEEALGQHYAPGGQIIRLMVACLPPGAEITSHIDQYYSFKISHRIHIPIKTTSDVVFMINGQNFFLKEGHIYEVNNCLEHAVQNKSFEDRIHLIFDYVPPENIHHLYD